MTDLDLTKLRETAEAPAPEPWQKAFSPSTVLALLDEIERLRARIEVLQAPEMITIPAPHVPYPGPNDTDASFMRGAAGKIRNGLEPGGYNVTTAVIKLLTDAANALEAGGDSDE
jgi:hypothetical protein